MFSKIWNLLKKLRRFTMESGTYDYTGNGWQDPIGQVHNDA